MKIWEAFDAILNRFPMTVRSEVNALAELEAERDVFEPDELWAATHRKQPTGTQPPPRLTSPQVPVGSTLEEGIGPALLQQSGAMEGRKPTRVENTMTSLSTRGFMSLTGTKVSSVSVSQMVYMGIVEARIDNLTLSLPLSDWASLFSSVNRASNNNLSRMIR